MPKCQLCKEEFPGQPWMLHCRQCYSANRYNLASRSQRRKLDEGARLAAAVDSRRSEARVVGQFESLTCDGAHGKRRGPRGTIPP